MIMTNFSIDDEFNRKMRDISARLKPLHEEFLKIAEEAKSCILTRETRECFADAAIPLGKYSFREEGRFIRRR